MWTVLYWNHQRDSFYENSKMKIARSVVVFGNARRLFHFRAPQFETQHIRRARHSLLLSLCVKKALRWRRHSLLIRLKWSTISPLTVLGIIMGVLFFFIAVVLSIRVTHTHTHYSYYYVDSLPWADAQLRIWQHFMKQGQRLMRNTSYQTHIYYLIVHRHSAERDLRADVC